MNILCRISVAVAAMAALVPIGAHARAPRTVTAVYVGTGYGTATTGCAAGVAGAPNIGGACFAIEASEDTIDVSIADVSGIPVGADLDFRDGGTHYGGIVFCGSIHNVAIPPQAREVVVSLDAFLGQLSCFTNGYPGTTGTITAMLSNSIAD